MAASSSTNADVATYVFRVPGMTTDEDRDKTLRDVLKLRGVNSINLLTWTEVTVSGETTINECELRRALNRASGPATLISLSNKPPSFPPTSSSHAADQVHSSHPSCNSDENQLAKEEDAEEIDVKRRRVEIGVGAFDAGDKDAEETKPDVDIPEKNNERKEEDAEKLKSSKAVDIIRQEADKISERVSALEAAANCGNKLTNGEFVEPSQWLRSELLKLDTIEPEGEAGFQLKAEVHRLLKLHDMLDELNTRNSNLNDSTTSVTDSMLPLKSET